MKRRFYHTLGFGGGTLYVEYTPDSKWGTCIDRYGGKSPTAISLKEALKYVKQGQWYEKETDVTDKVIGVLKG